MSIRAASAGNVAEIAADARRERARFLMLSAPALCAVALGALLPLVWIARQSFLSRSGEATFENYERLLSSPLTWNAVVATLQLSLGTLALCLLLGVPLAFALASVSPRAANRLLILVLMPLWTSSLVRTYAWLVLLRREGAINHALVNTGLVSDPLPLVYNLFGTYVGMVQYMLPIFVLPVYAAMRDIDRNTIFAAASMGASLWRTFVFVSTLGFFITPAVLGGGHVSPIAIRIDRMLSTLQDWGGASALGVLLFVLVIGLGVSFFVLARLWRAPAKAGT